MVKQTLIFITMFIFVAYGCVMADQNINAVKKYSSSKPFVPGEVVVKYKRAQPGDLGSLPHSMGISGKDHVRIKKLFKKMKQNGRTSISMASSDDKIDEPGLYKLTYEGRDDIYSIVEGLKASADVEYAEPNYIYQAAVVPNDPNYSTEWGFSKIGAPAAWDVTKGSSDVVIAVIDTGVDYRHQDLSQNIWRNEDELPDNGIDDDGNGYIDDDKGWDFVTIPADWVSPGEDPGPQDNDPMDVMGHGTHVAGIAAGRPNNSVGIAGTAWNCKIMSLRAGYKFIDGSGYLDLADVAEAVYYAADNGANVINMSFGCTYNSSLLREAINYAYSKGCVMAASAGNVDAYDAGRPFYPAACEHVIAVSAVDDRDKVAIWGYDAFSNFGEFVDICAPGSYIISTLPNNSYGYGSGTSMAAPFVSGVAALVRSKHIDWTPDQIESRLKETCDDIYSINSQAFFIGKLGAGRVSAKKALGNLSMAITYPKPSSIISGSVVVKGSADMENFSSYKLEYANASDESSWVPIGAGSDTPVLNGLLGVWSVDNPDGRYKIKLTVSNTNGELYECVSGVNFGIDGEVRLSARPQCGPSPFDPRKTDFLFYYDLLAASEVDIYVYDISGTLLWQRSLPYDGGISGSGGSAGPNRVFWSGENSFGDKLGNGAYIYMIIASDGGERKIIGRGKFAVLRS